MLLDLVEWHQQGSAVVIMRAVECSDSVVVVQFMIHLAPTKCRRGTERLMMPTPPRVIACGLCIDWHRGCPNRRVSLRLQLALRKGRPVVTPTSSCSSRRISPQFCPR